MSYQKVIILGAVGKDPEVRRVADRAVASFSVATSETYKDRNGQRKEVTEWHNISMWDKAAEFVEKYVKKGSTVFIEGKIKTRDYEDKNGNKRYVTEIVSNTIQLVGNKKKENNDDLPY